ncbi:hypothetical protein D3C74_321170 [compost metagenome]
MTASPRPFATMVPFETDATELSLDVHEAVWVTSCVEPSLLVTTAVTVSDWSAFMLIELSLKASDSSMTGSAAFTAVGTMKVPTIKGPELRPISSMTLLVFVSITLMLLLP